jgi:hypothetical protein
MHKTGRRSRKRNRFRGKSTVKTSVMPQRRESPTTKSSLFEVPLSTSAEIQRDGCLAEQAELSEKRWRQSCTVMNEDEGELIIRDAPRPRSIHSSIGDRS